MERDRLWLADFDPAVHQISGLAFWLAGRDGSTSDLRAGLLLRLGDGRCRVVDVKPARLLDDPKVAEVLAWTGRLCAGEG